MIPARALAWRLAIYPALLLAALSFALFWAYAHPKRYRGAATPAAHRLPYEKIKLLTSDGLELDGWFIPNKKSRRAIVICHGYPMDKSDVLGMTAFLARDFNLVYFDFRAMGKSAGTFSTGGAKERRDIAAAVNWLKGRGLGEIGLFGFSMGGSAALMADDPSIKARAADSPYASLAGELEYTFAGLGIWRRPFMWSLKFWSLVLTGTSIGSVNPAAAAAGLKGPVLLIHGENDGHVPAYNSLMIKAALPAAELWLVKNADHGECRYAAGAAYEARLLKFFDSSLK